MSESVLVWVDGFQKQRKKRFSRKTKSDYETCKQGRIRCDEGKPTRANCNRSGRQCEGSQLVKVGTLSIDHSDAPTDPASIFKSSIHDCDYKSLQNQIARLCQSVEQSAATSILSIAINTTSAKLQHCLYIPSRFLPLTFTLFDHGSILTISSPTEVKRCSILEYWYTVGR